MTDDDTIHTDGGVSLFTGEPFVTVRVGKEGWQWSCDEARAFALLLIRTAGYAEDDAILVREMQSMQLPDAAMAGFLTAIRAARP